jgi:hypothetical protein
MEALTSFSGLIEAISRAVAQAQDEVERHQVRNLLSYFDAKGRPRGIEFRVPSLRSDARPGEEDFYGVPLLSLVSINVLKIKDVEIKFAVDLGSLDEQAPEPAPAPEAASGDAAADDRAARLRALVQPMKTLSVSTATGSGGGKVKVVLRVEGSEPSEGAARLLNHLAQTQGVYREIHESTSTDPDAAT